MKNTLNMLREASYEAAATVQVNAFQLVESRRKRTLGAGTAVVLGLLIAAAPAVAQGCLKGSQSNAAQTLEKFFNGAAMFMIYIGGAAALLMFAVGGFLFIVAGSGPEVSKAKKIIKNAIIGLVILVAGLLIKTVVVSLVSGISSGQNSAKCLKNKGW